MTTTDEEQLDPGESDPRTTPPEKAKDPTSSKGKTSKRNIDANYLRNKSLIVAALDTIGVNKLNGFIKYEVKPVGDDNFRVNVICTTMKPTNFLPAFSRPLSYYVTVNSDKGGNGEKDYQNNPKELTFCPPLQSATQY